MCGPCVQVRKNAMMVLTHLILNDMMKASCTVLYCAVLCMP